MLKVSLLIALAWAKAVIVAMYFMHLAMERRGLWIIALTPVVLVTFLCFMLLPDLTTRMWTRFDHKIKVPYAETTQAVLDFINLAHHCGIG